MPFNGEPATFEQVASGLFVAKHPGVQAIKMKLAPIFAVPPVFWLVGVRPSGVAVCLVKHPAIQFTKDFLGYRRAEVGGPSPNNWVELLQDQLNIASLCFVPLILELLLHVLDGFCVRFD